MTRTATALAAAALFAAAPAAAQSCIGFPADQPGEVAVALAFNTLTGGERWGFEGDYNMHNDFSVFGTVGVTDPEAADVENATYVGVGGAFFAGTITNALNQSIVGCPTVSITFADVEDTEVYSVPVGFGVGTSMQLGEGDNQLHPYVLPALVYTDAGEETSTDFQFSLGANVTWGNTGFYAGGSVNRVFVENADSEFAFRVGFVF